jgi:hypothetical protein
MHEIYAHFALLGTGIGAKQTMPQVRCTMSPCAHRPSSTPVYPPPLKPTLPRVCMGALTSPALLIGDDAILHRLLEWP